VPFVPFVPFVLFVFFVPFVPWLCFGSFVSGWARAVVTQKAASTIPSPSPHEDVHQSDDGGHCSGH
jgi:hypothetical protein